MKFEELKQTLVSNIDNFYLIYGEDEFAKDSALNQIKSKVVTEFPELNYVVFYGDNLEEKNFFEVLESVPFLSEKKFVVLKIFNNKKLPFLDRLTAYLKNPSEFCVFAIVCDEIFSIKGTKPTLIDCNNISQATIKKYIIVQTQKNNIDIDFDAIDLLIQYSNGNMSFVDTELKKCMAYTNHITIDTIKELVSLHTEYQIYEFTNSIGKKENEKCIEIMNNFLSNKNIMPTLLYLLYSHFRKLYFISISSKNDIELSEEYKIKPYAVKKLREQLKFYNKNQLENILKLISDSDYKIKNGELDIKSAVYNIVFSAITGNL
ncbi:MAG: DNA polymerase III subunit delta [Clostridia bacterium]|nr:DNA polymerase III subunit delta [Clostridia bacterium]